MSAKKQNCPVELNIQDALCGLREGVYYTSSLHQWAINNGYTYVCCGIDQFVSAGAKISDRYVVQEISLPENQKGKLRPFAAHKVDVIFSTIKQNSRQIEAYLKVIK